MATVADVEMLNRALEDLGKQFYLNRELAARSDESRRRTELGQAELSQRGLERADTAKARQEEAEARRGHEQRMEAHEKAILDRQETQAAIKQLNDAYDTISGQVDAGTITPEEAKAKAKTIQQAVEAAPSLAWKNSRFGLVGTDFKKGTAGDYTEDPVTGERFFQPRGSHQTLRSGNRNPNVVWETDPMTGELRMKRLSTKGAANSDMLNDLGIEPGGGLAPTDPIKARVDEIDRQIREHQLNIAQGDQRTGLFNYKNRDDAIQALREERAKLVPLLQQPGGGVTPARTRGTNTALQAPPAPSLDLSTSAPPAAAGLPAPAPAVPQPTQPAAPATSAGRVFTDKTGARWRYIGQGDPTQDRDPSSWQAVP